MDDTRAVTTTTDQPKVVPFSFDFGSEFIRENLPAPSFACHLDCQRRCYADSPDMADEMNPVVIEYVMLRPDVRNRLNMNEMNYACQSWQWNRGKKINGVTQADEKSLGKCGSKMKTVLENAKIVATVSNRRNERVFPGPVI